MAALTGNTIASSYTGLLKTTDNAALGATEKNLTDGAGNASTLSMGTASASFTGTLDLSGATVTGLPGGTPGLVSGTGADAMKSADFLTPLNTPNATGSKAIAIGYGADATGTNSLALGVITEATNTGSCAIGPDTHSTAIGGTAIGFGTYAQASYSTAIGYLTRAEINATDGIAIGKSTFARATNAVIIGARSVVDDLIRVDTVVLGADAKAAQYSTALGYGSFAIGDYAISVGDSTAAGSGGISMGYGALANQNYSIGIGYNSDAQAQYGVALGYQVTNTWAAATTVNQLQIENYAALNYADDTAAAAGGVALGGVYHNSGALRIRIV